MENINKYDIKITNCEILKGEYKYDPAFFKYMFISSSSDVNPSRKFLKINFDSNNKDSKIFVVTSSESEHSPYYQHTISQNQREFFFELEDNIPLDKLRINGLKFLPTSYIFNHKTEIVERSDLLINIINKANQDNKSNNIGKKFFDDKEQNDNIKITI